MLTALCASVFAQTHTSVPLENQIYYILEQAQLRGLCSPLSGVRPYTQSVIISAINEILISENSGRLNAAEREILEQYRRKFSRPAAGLDWNRGGLYGETTFGSHTISADLSVSASFEGSAGLYMYTSGNEDYFGTDSWGQVFLNGDIGANFSYGLTFALGVIKAPRNDLGQYFPFHNGFVDDPDGKGQYLSEPVNVYSEPLSHFPYSYRKQWDGSVIFFNNLAGYEGWPDGFAIGYGLLSEITASFFESKFLIRFGRISHEWGSTPLGSSLTFNQAARPFFGIEAELNPASWLTIATLTGALEYENRESIKRDAMSFQNFFSIIMLQLRFGNYVSFDYLDTVVYPKRFELGYISPVTSNYFYQDNVGDFDNLAMAFNLKAQYPGIGNIWASLFIDEISFLADLFKLDKQMFAIQAGTTIFLPFFSFSSIKISYTMVNPYTYTHPRNFTPWYGESRMETSYTNNGVSLGYYLPPNSDELLVRFDTMPARNITLHLQYQMIRHGADFGPSAVDGSNLFSELDPDGREDKPELRRSFLRDGAYQWLHIIRIGAEWTLEKAPIALFCELGTVISYFTINGTNSGKVVADSYPTDPYSRSTAFIARIGFRLFPR
jgi:hypothetical protein